MPWGRIKQKRFILSADISYRDINLMFVEVRHNRLVFYIEKYNFVGKKNVISYCFNFKLFMYCFNHCRLNRIVFFF